MPDADLLFAFELVDLAAEMSLKPFHQRQFGVETKADGSLVTTVDREVESALRERIARYHPRDHVVGEELGGDRGSGRCWYIDPIDGTHGYVGGTDGWNILISLADRGDVRVGVVDFPARGRRFWASSGQGAFADGNPMHVSDVDHLGKATVCDDYRHNVENRAPGHPLVRVADRAAKVHPHQGHSMLAVADGRAEVALGSGGGPWDYAPFVVVIHEAGGRCSDLRGELRFDTGSLLATNGLVHAEVLAAIDR